MYTVQITHIYVHRTYICICMYIIMYILHTHIHVYVKRFTNSLAIFTLRKLLFKGLWRLAGVNTGGKGIRHIHIELLS